MNKTGEYSIEKEKLVIEAAKKNHRKFAPLYDRYFNQIFLFVLKRTSDEQLCADLTSQVFMKALTKLPGYKHMGYPFSAWLYRIAINEVNMHFRKSKKHQTIEVKEGDVKVMMHAMSDEDDDSSKIMLVMQNLSKLKDAQQQLIELRFFEKYSFKEIGEIIGTTEGNAKIKTYRALEKLKQLTLE